MYPLLILLFAAIACPVISSAQVDDCKIMHQGKFMYMADDEEVIVEIKDSTFTEYHNGGKHTIRGRIDWLNSCEYLVTIRKVNLPSFPLTSGDQVNVKIYKIEDKEIFYIIKVKDVSWAGKFLKVE